MDKISEYLTKRQLKALAKIGDVMIPGNEPFPSFSQTGCIRYVDKILMYMAPEDLGDFKMLLWLLSFWPRCLISLLLRFLCLDLAR